MTKRVHWWDDIAVELERSSAMEASKLPLSPPPEPKISNSNMNEAVDLDSPLRTTPIHPLLPDIRVPSDPLPSHRYHPVTCAPLDIVELQADLQQLRKEYTTSVAARKAQEEAAKKVKRRIEEAKEKTEHIQKIMQRKTEEREMERKVFLKIKKEKEGKMQGVQHDDVSTTDP
ncbi:uncharacterized protein GIQ15_01178 [Arthroderma uncinatum]|uniref:uncharacterized protein n=1 Tax=Arthroderma uncinatum TaxID=74035 RepID=UPI00144A555E|nr:uncharacterized protein GIQ15_01178 [Arthroderma uncinatum]KAF3491661.1 hypothetical protein GIQ15_01178 [Arthroderma uncinatum]